MKRVLQFFLFFFTIAHVVANAALPSGRSCFCKFHENVDECECSLESVDEYNNKYLYPLLQKLLKRNFFKYYKVNMDKQCPFWPDERECGSRECGIESCDDEVPAVLKEFDVSPRWHPFLPEEHEASVCTGRPGDETLSTSGQESNQFDPLDTHISDASHKQLQQMENYEDEEHKFCDVDDEDPTSMHYVDLSRNPERYTGYKGNSAQMVWKSIYQENCFKPNPKFDKNFLLSPSITGLCLEKRVFFRVISGLHTSITISIAAHNYVPPPGGFGQGTWKRNLDMFKARFSPETTWGEGPQRLKNLYFVYLLELRALHKLAPYLRTQQMFYTGNEEEDAETRRLMEQLHETIQDFPDHFDESAMFQQSHEALARELKEEFRVHFWNVSRIMDCVGCDKCRLWGKLQTHGLGTAFKVLFSNIIPSCDNVKDVPFSLTRNDLVALLQSFGRFSSSVYEVSQFRNLLDT